MSGFAGSLQQLLLNGELAQSKHLCTNRNAAELIKKENTIIKEITLFIPNI